MSTKCSQTFATSFSDQLLYSHCPIRTRILYRSFGVEVISFAWPSSNVSIFLLESAYKCHCDGQYKTLKCFKSTVILHLHIKSLTARSTMYFALKFITCWTQFLVKKSIYLGTTQFNVRTWEFTHYICSTLINFINWSCTQPWNKFFLVFLRYTTATPTQVFLKKRNNSKLKWFFNDVNFHLLRSFISRLCVFEMANVTNGLIPGKILYVLVFNIFCTVLSLLWHYFHEIIYLCLAMQFTFRSPIVGNGNVLAKMCHFNTNSICMYVAMSLCIFFRY